MRSAARLTDSPFGTKRPAITRRLVILRQMDWTQADRDVDAAPTTVFHPEPYGWDFGFRDSSWISYVASSKVSNVIDPSEAMWGTVLGNVVFSHPTPMPFGAEPSWATPENPQSVPRRSVLSEAVAERLIQAQGNREAAAVLMHHEWLGARVLDAIRRLGSVRMTELVDQVVVELDTLAVVLAGLTSARLLQADQARFSISARGLEMVRRLDALVSS